jgi:hypothetical protein
MLPISGHRLKVKKAINQAMKNEESDTSSAYTPLADNANQAKQDSVCFLILVCVTWLKTD